MIFQIVFLLFGSFSWGASCLPLVSDPVSILVASKGPVDVNKIPIGIENTFTPQKAFASKDEAMAAVGALAQTFAVSQNKPVQTRQENLHGDGILDVHRVQGWRFEWDGVQTHPVLHGGQVEVASPKMAPQSVKDEIKTLFEAAQSLGLQGQRRAGGAHANVDVATLKKLPVKVGIQALLNLIRYFESHQEMILFLWQHPKRFHSAHPVVRTVDLMKNLNQFEGDWAQLGKMLYVNRYFNAFETRRAKYVPLNVTPLMMDFVPEKFKQFAGVDWHPQFTSKGERIELRFFDAPGNLHEAALQILYLRALLNHTLNSPEKILFESHDTSGNVEAWKKDPQAWQKAFAEHLQSLGLDPRLFQDWAAQSRLNQIQFKPRDVDYVIHTNFD